ncbi:MAG: endonuclease/exonuclease/phosphatase family protein [Sandaracinaceae bacterium]
MASSELRVVTWNIRTGRGLDGRVDLDRVARVLAPLDAEVVALQELDVSRARTRGVDQPHWLADRLGMHATFCGAVEDADGGRYGHALLTRRPPDRADVTLLPRLPLREQRGAIDVDVHTSLGPVRVLSVHLGLLELERVLQVRPLTAIARRAERPMVLLGDLNASAQMPSMRLLRRAFTDASARTPAHTWHARFPVRRLDYALIRGLRSVGSRVLSEGDAARASDHLPLAVDLGLLITG